MSVPREILSSPVLRRVTDWQARLLALIEIASKRSFAWGVFDCAILAIEAIQAVTGHRFDVPIDWQDEASADAFIDGYGGGLDTVVSSWLGAPAPYGRLGAGDIFYAVWTTGEVLAIHDGSQLLAPGLDGLRRIPYRCVRAGWRVG